MQVEEVQKSEVLLLPLEGPAPLYRLPLRLQGFEEDDFPLPG